MVEDRGGQFSHQAPFYPTVYGHQTHSPSATTSHSAGHMPESGPNTHQSNRHPRSVSNNNGGGGGYGRNKAHSHGNSSHSGTAHSPHKQQTTPIMILVSRLVCIRPSSSIYLLSRQFFHHLILFVIYHSRILVETRNILLLSAVLL